MLMSKSPSHSVAKRSPARSFRSPKPTTHTGAYPHPSSQPPVGKTPPTGSSIDAKAYRRSAAAAAAATAVQPTRAETADAGTQYSPPDWPPTDPRSSLHQRRSPTDRPLPAARAPSTNPPPTIATYTTAQPPSQESAAPSASPVPPPNEPLVRITPSTSLQNVAAASRSRPRSSPSTSIAPSQNEGSPIAPTSKLSKLTESSDVVTVLPTNYADCDPKILAKIIAFMLMRLITHNDSIPLKDGQLTRFHSRTPPGISVHDYLQRLTFHATLLPPILLSMVFFIDRLSAKFPQFIINSLTVHRFLITAATVASKGLSDSFWTNSTYARVGGVSVKELALLELELLMKADWKIVPTNEELMGYYKGLVDGCEGYVVEGQQQEESAMIDESTADQVEEKERNATTQSQDRRKLSMEEAVESGTSSGSASDVSMAS